MPEPFDTEFLDRRIGQLWAEANRLIEESPEQERIERLACELSDYLRILISQIAGRSIRATKRALLAAPIHPASRSFAQIAHLMCVLSCAYCSRNAFLYGAVAVGRTRLRGSCRVGGDKK